LAGQTLAIQKGLPKTRGLLDKGENNLAGQRFGWSNFGNPKRFAKDSRLA
jgi:hypothetical protein